LAYLIRTGNSADLRDAVAYASTEWGGYSHPIVPIDRRGRIEPHLQIARMLTPDFLVNYAGASADTVSRVARLVGSEPIFTRDVQFGLHPLALDSATELRSRTMLVPARPANLRELVALGRIPSDQTAVWMSMVGQI